MKKAILSSLLLVVSVFATDQTNYDLIRPVYPMTWDDTSSVENGGTVYSFSKFTPPSSKETARLYPADGAKPAEFKPNGFISDTLDQAFIDALSLSVSDIRVNQAGYLPSDPEQLFYYIDESGKCDATYSVVDTDGKEVAKGGTLAKTEGEMRYIRKINAYESSSVERYSVLDSIEKRPVCKGKLADMAGLPKNKRLRVKVGKELSSTFIISDEVYSMVRDANLKFFGAQRSGNSESWFHGPSHMKDGDGALTGGWYDAGDYVKFSGTMSYAFMVLSLMATVHPELDDDHYAYNHNQVETTDGVPDVLREAKHGADFFMRSYVHAKGVIDDMVVTVGDFMTDHEVWMHCDSMDAYANAPERTLYYGELGADASSNIATGLALLSKSYAQYDKAFADSCLMVAEKLYAFAKELALGGSFPHNKAPTWDHRSFYPSNPNFNDELAMAAIALHYATYEKTGKMDYLEDAVSNKEIAESVNAKYNIDFFEGGWFGFRESGFNRGGWVSDYHNIHSFALYAFYKLLLADEKTGKKYGLDDARLTYLEKVLFAFLRIISEEGSEGDSELSTFTCGDETGYQKGDRLYLNNSKVPYNGLSFQLWDTFTWSVNSYNSGATMDLLFFADMAKEITESKVDFPSVKNIKLNYDDAKQIAVNNLNFVLGMNSWDQSFVIGVGDKNESHVYNRTSNPEGSNRFSKEEYERRYQELLDTTQWSEHEDDFLLKEDAKLKRELSDPGYSYRPMVGALMGGNALGRDTILSDAMYYVSVGTSLWGAANMLSSLMLLSKEHSTAAAPDTSKSDSSVVKTDTTATKDSTDKKDSTDSKGKKISIPNAPAGMQNLNVVKFGSMLDVSYSLNVAAPATVKLVSVSGHVVRNYNGGNLGAGSHTVRFDMSQVPAGIYIVKVCAGSLSETKMIKLTE